MGWGGDTLVRPSTNTKPDVHMLVSGHLTHLVFHPLVLLSVPLAQVWDWSFPAPAVMLHAVTLGSGFFFINN